MILDAISKTELRKQAFISAVMLCVYTAPLVRYYFVPALTNQILTILFIFPALTLLLFFTSKPKQKLSQQPVNFLRTLGTLLLLQSILFSITNHIGSMSFQYNAAAFSWNSTNSLWWACLWCLYLSVAIVIKNSHPQHYVTPIPNLKDSLHSIFIKRGVIICCLAGSIVGICSYYASIIITMIAKILATSSATLPKNNTNDYIFYFTLTTIILMLQLGKIYRLCYRLRLNLGVYLIGLGALLAILVLLVSAITEIAGIIPFSLHFTDLWLPRGYSALTFGLMAAITPYIATILAHIFKYTSTRTMIVTAILFPLGLLTYSQAWPEILLPEWFNWIGMIGFVSFAIHPYCAELVMH